MCIQCLGSTVIKSPESMILTELKKSMTVQFGDPWSLKDDSPSFLKKLTVSCGEVWNPRMMSDEQSQA